MATNYQVMECYGDAADFIAASRRDSGTIESGDFVIDLENRTATLQGRELSLDDAEFDLVIFLTTHRRKVVTPRTLLITQSTNQRARGKDFLPVLLSLRKKLEAAVPERHYIRVEPWILCRFEPRAQ